MNRDASRRQFLKTSAFAALLAGCGRGGGDDRATVALPNSGRPFPRSVLSASRLELDGDLSVVAGELPADLEGHAFVIGALPYGNGAPLFTGDAMIYRLSFAPGRARIKTRILRTDDFLVDEAAAADPALAFHNNGFVRFSPALGARDFANTAIVPLSSGRAIATYDAGRPWEFDPSTLEVVTPVGLQSSWKPFLPPIAPGLELFPIHMTTAHPCWDEDDRALYGVNYATKIDGVDVVPFVRVVRWDGASEPAVFDVVDERGEKVVLTQSCHQMQVTRKYVVLSDGAFKIEPQQMLGNDVTEAQSPLSVLWVIDKTALIAGAPAKAKRVQIPLESAHFLVDRADDGDRITVMLMHQNSSDPSEWVRATDLQFRGGAVDPSTVGMTVAPADLTPMGRYVIDARTGTVVAGSDKKLLDPRLFGTTLFTQDARTSRARIGTAWWSTFGFIPDLLTQRIVDVYRDHPYRQIALSELPKRASAPQLLRVDHDAMSIGDAYAMPIGTLPMSPTFVPARNGGRDEGYLVMFTCGPDADEVWIFSASELAAGPRCRLRHPQLDVGFTLHTAWLGDLGSGAKPGYRVDRRADYGDRLAGLSPDARALARRVLAL